MHSLLVVHSVEEVRAVIGRMLAREGFEALLARDCAEAVLLLERAGSVDAILIEVYRGAGGGVDTLASLRALPRCSGVPALACVADAFTADELVAAGFQGWISHPFNGSSLMVVLREVLGSEV